MTDKTGGGVRKSPRKAVQSLRQTSLEEAFGGAKKKRAKMNPEVIVIRGDSEDHKEEDTAVETATLPQKGNKSGEVTEKSPKKRISSQKGEANDLVDDSKLDGRGAEAGLLLKNRDEEQEKKKAALDENLELSEESESETGPTLGLEMDVDDEKPSSSRAGAGQPQLEKIPSLGVDLNKFNRSPICWGEHYPGVLKPGPSHTVLIKTNTLAQGERIEPFPSKLTDKWDSDHVRMPFSYMSEYPVKDAKGEEKVEKRWDLIEAALVGTKFTCSQDLEDAILSYNGRQRWKFRGLHRYFNEEVSEEEAQVFFEETLPAMAKLALRLPALCTQPIPLLKRGMNHSVTMSQEQAASLLANAFFCTFPRRNKFGRNAEFGNYPDINFSSLFTIPHSEEKLKCIFHYFKRITTDMPRGTLTFERRGFKKFPAWKESKQALRDLHVSQKGTIEDYGEGFLQVDFANKFLGGGVLGHGCVQEEIRFLICPEMIISKLITEALDDHESLIMTGCERFSYYAGYASSFTWNAPFVDESPRDAWGRRVCEVVAIDAICFSSSMYQFFPKSVDRELNKAFAGFCEPGRKAEDVSAVATGNWGCGAFGGDVEMKSLIQLMAAAEAGRDVAYFTFDDKQLMLALHELFDLLKKNKTTVGELYSYMIGYYEAEMKGARRKPTISLFDHIHSHLPSSQK